MLSNKINVVSTNGGSFSINGQFNKLENPLSNATYSGGKKYIERVKHYLKRFWLFIVNVFCFWKATNQSNADSPTHSGKNLTQDKSSAKRTSPTLNNQSKISEQKARSKSQEEKFTNITEKEKCINHNDCVIDQNIINLEVQIANKADKIEVDIKEIHEDIKEIHEDIKKFRVEMSKKLDHLMLLIDTLVDVSFQ